MIKPSIDEMLEISGSRYTLIVATAKRARAILNANKESASGTLCEIDTSIDELEKPVTRAVKDIYNGKFEIVTNNDETESETVEE